MAVTIHVNGTSNSLAHKGSMGIAKSTLPDVCKTPSPAGPVPIPYPIIISMTSSLTGGTTTVKVDGGNMAAVKGSELSRCNGDEPGTAGGVKSSTNMKEATWLLYSFDVKMEGKNACRLTDKLQMNHGNSACLGGLIQRRVSGQNVIYLTCDPNWSDCQKKQMRAKVRAMNDQISGQGGQTKLRTVSSQKVKAKKKKYQTLYGDTWDSKTPTGKYTYPDQEPCNQKTQFYHKCAEKAAAGDPLNRKGLRTKNIMQADHIMETQLVGGRVGGPFRWLDESVNTSSGAQIAKVQQKHGNITIHKFITRGC